MVSASNLSLAPKISASGVKEIVVPVPRTFAPAFNFVVGAPRE